jgi:hypothetical protein
MAEKFTFTYDYQMQELLRAEMESFLTRILVRSTERLKTPRHLCGYMERYFD